MLFGAMKNREFFLEPTTDVFTHVPETLVRRCLSQRYNAALLRRFLAAHHHRSRDHRRRPLRAVPGVRARAARYRLPTSSTRWRARRPVHRAVSGQADLRHSRRCRSAARRSWSTGCMQQITPFNAPFHLGQEVTELRKREDGRFDVRHRRRHHASMPARWSSPAGVGSFQPRRIGVAGRGGVRRQVHPLPRARRRAAATASSS